MNQMKAVGRIGGMLGWGIALVALATAPWTAFGQTADSGSGSGQGQIAVHGHWTIDVLEPDGTLVSRHEFENALLFEGQAFLAHALGRQRTPGGWSVLVDGGCDTDPGNLSDSTDCLMVESTSQYVGSYVFKTLTVSAPTSGDDRNKLVLAGSATVLTDGQIGRVSTGVGACDPSIAPGSCTQDPPDRGPSLTTVCPDKPDGHCDVPLQSAYDVTSKTLPSPVSVVAGQQVNVTVRLSFS